MTVLRSARAQALGQRVHDQVTPEEDLLDLAQVGDRKSSATTATTRTAYWIIRRRLALGVRGPRLAGGARAERYRKTS